MTTQPVWKTVWQTDCTWLHADETGEYEPELTVAQEDEDAEQWYVYRVVLERYKEVRVENQIYLVPFGWNASWSHPTHRYAPWFYRHLESIADSVGRTKREIVEDLCSDDPGRLASAYQDIYGHHGYANGDGEPMSLNYRQFERFWDGKPPGPEKGKYVLEFTRTQLFRAKVTIEAVDDDEAEKIGRLIEDGKYPVEIDWGEADEDDVELVDFDEEKEEA